MENQIHNKPGNVSTDDEFKKKLEKLLRECNSETEFRQRCEQEFANMRSVYISWGTGIRIANLYIHGHDSPISACVS